MRLQDFTIVRSIFLPYRTQCPDESIYYWFPQLNPSARYDSRTEFLFEKNKSSVFSVPWLLMEMNRLYIWTSNSHAVHRMMVMIVGTEATFK
jgi:hypothetical protein